MDGTPAVLLVSNDDGLRSQLGEWLDGAGIDLVSCPSPADQPCIAMRGGLCALEIEANVVVLDMRVDGSTNPRASLYRSLTDYYLKRRHGVLVMSDDLNAVIPSGAAVCPRILPRGEFLDAVASLALSASRSFLSGSD